MMSRVATRVGTARPGPARPNRVSSRRRKAARWARLGLLVLLVVLALATASAQARAESVQIVALAGSIEEVLTNIRNWIMGIIALVATVFLTIGGVRYVLASGDPGEVGKAKEAFKNAGFGYVLAALAPLVVQILRGIVGA